MGVPVNSVMGQIDDQDRRPSLANTRIMVAAVVVLFIVVLFILLLHIYARWFWRAARLRSSGGSGIWSRRRRRRMNFVAVSAMPLQAETNMGLEKAVLESLPVFYYTRKVSDGQEKVNNGQSLDDGEEVLDCAVCLSEFEENEAGRRLPNCNHVFHTDCIDMWFGSHTTCPLCRTNVAVEADSKSSQGEELLREAVMVGLQGQEQQTSSGNEMAIQILQDEGAVLLTDPHIHDLGQDRIPPVQAPGEVNSEIAITLPLIVGTSSPVNPKHLVIDVPQRSAGNFSSACSSQFPSPTTTDGQRSPLGTHLRNLKKLLSRDSRRYPVDAASVDCGDHFACQTPGSMSGCHTPTSQC